MDSASSQTASRQPGTQLPEWETPKEDGQLSAKGKHSSTRGKGFIRPQTHIATFFNRRMPSHKRYCGLRRRNALLSICLVILLLLALIIGLSVGLTSRARANDSLFLPLPSDAQSFKGDLTYYGPGLGACGITSGDEDNIVSVSHFLFDDVSIGSNPNSNPLCGLMIRAERMDERVDAQRSVDLKVVDRCMTYNCVGSRVADDLL